MSDLRDRLIEFFSDDSLFHPCEGPEEWADELLEQILDDEPLAITFEGSTDVYYRLREVVP